MSNLYTIIPISLHSFGSGTNQYLMDDLNCHGNEQSLADCDFAGWGEHDCQASEVRICETFLPYSSYMEQNEASIEIMVIMEMRI